MQTVLLYLHNILRWIILILLLISIGKSLSGWLNKKAFTQQDRKIWLFTMITAHITLLIGLIQLAFGRYGIFTTSLPEGTNLMKNKFYRFFWIEHPVAMILAIGFITMAYRMSKKSVSDEVKYKRAFMLFILALIFILAGVPWPFREIVGRPLFPGT